MPLLGIWLTLAPVIILGTDGVGMHERLIGWDSCHGAIKTPLADIGHLGGAMIVTVLVISMVEVVRIVRCLNIPLAIVIAVGSRLARSDQTSLPIVFELIAMAVTGLSSPRGRITQTYGQCDCCVR